MKDPKVICLWWDRESKREMFLALKSRGTHRRCRKRTCIRMTQFETTESKFLWAKAHVETLEVAFTSPWNKTKWRLNTNWPSGTCKFWALGPQWCMSNASLGKPRFQRILIHERPLNTSSGIYFGAMQRKLSVKSQMIIVLFELV